MAVYALIGYPLEHSLSPQVMASLFEETGVDAKYTLFPVKPERLAEGVKSLLSMKIAGFNITRPFKKSIIPLLTELSDEAKAIGAVNCVKVVYPVLTTDTPLTKFAHSDLDLKKAEIRLVGYNTDAYGFSTLLDLLPGSRIRNTEFRVIVLGTGGSAKAVAYVLSKRGILFTFIRRSTIPVSNTPNPAQAADYSTLPALLAHASLVVNCTPVGQFPNVSEMLPIPLDGITKGHAVIDLIYNPEKTKLLAECEKRGATVLNGYPMLVAQAEKSLEIWLGRPEVA
ncbi:MAG: shikimate dehydrogenase family protein [bacterium]